MSIKKIKKFFYNSNLHFFIALSWLFIFYNLVFREGTLANRRNEKKINSKNNISNIQRLKEYNCRWNNLNENNKQEILREILKTLKISYLGENR